LYGMAATFILFWPKTAGLIFIKWARNWERVQRSSKRYQCLLRNIGSAIYMSARKLTAIWSVITTGVCWQSSNAKLIWRSRTDVRSLGSFTDHTNPQKELTATLLSLCNTWSTQTGFKQFLSLLTETCYDVHLWWSTYVSVLQQDGLWSWNALHKRGLATLRARLRLPD
jgi:hypothetical protein